jgi:acyl dehydratase
LYRGIPRRIDEKSLLYFSGGDRDSPQFPSKTIHTNLEFAKECGLKERIASGSMSEGFIVELMVDIMGDKWFEMGKMRLKFIRPVVIGDIVMACARLQDKSDDNIILEVWCENQNKEKIAVGGVIIENFNRYSVL